MSQAEVAFLIAFGITAIFSTVTACCLGGALQRLLLDLCGTTERARFWTLFTNILLFLVPIMTILLGRTAERTSELLVFQVADQFKWALLGLVGTLVFVAVVVSSFIRTAQGGAIRMSPDQLDGLQRLLSRVEEIRARDIVQRAGSAT